MQADNDETQETATTTGRWLRRHAGTVAATLLAMAVVVLGVELALSATQGFALPFVPYHADALGVPRMFPDRTLSVRMGQGPAIAYTTDARGRRIAPGVRQADDVEGVVVLGDSQALGYGMPFESTFASRFGARAAPGAPVRILGAPSMDPETLALRACEDAAGHGEQARLQVIVYNLGNDLDEMYIAGQSRRSVETGMLHSWLAPRSQLYARFAIWQSRRALARHPAPGINPMLFGLDAGERIVLARESLTRIDEINRCTRARKRIVLILPSDFQVDPAELGKYARYSADPVRFRNWYAKRETFAAMMNAIEDYLLLRLRSDGGVAVSFREEAVARGIPAERLFDRDSHHLTVEGHAFAAELLAGAAR